jgi:hypothetical protein
VYQLKKFNVTGVCIPEEHYMVNTQEKQARIMSLIQDGKYFTINRARQFGKTTMLMQLNRQLNSIPEYTCIRLTFEGVGDEMFSDDEAFCKEFLIQINESLHFNGYDSADKWLDDSIKGFSSLGRHISKLCNGKKIVLLVDEVDATVNNKVFLRFLGMLRSLFLKRAEKAANTFHSVILAGVHDIKNIKSKLISAGLHNMQNEHEGEYNSPWNIATNFDVDMFFTATEISTMLTDYDNEHGVGMNIIAVAEEIFRFTNGYPYLVSRVCQYIDEKTNLWTVEGVRGAVKVIATERSVLKDDIFKNLENNKEIYDFMYSLLIGEGQRKVALFDPVVERCAMFGFITIDSLGMAGVGNMIFEMAMTEYFISKENSTSAIARQVCNGMYKEITSGGKFNMELCLQRFAEHYDEIYSSADETFLERHGRLIFLSFLRPLVNGVGFFHIESQFTDMRRMDVVVDYGREQFIIELKLWKGEKAQERAYEQLLDYMNSKMLDNGYLLTFDFRKNENKERKSEWISVDGKQIFEVII